MEKAHEFTPPPPSFDGPFSQFYASWIETNLPSADRVAAFDALLRRYLLEADPVHIVRYVRPQERGKTAITNQSVRLKPTDNAPSWWLNAFLLSGEAFPAPWEIEPFFAHLPSHFFEAVRFRTLNTAGFHAAHIVNAKDGNTDWALWTRHELARRMLVNLHPCNLFLVAKKEWQRNGGRSEIIGWVAKAFHRRYGSTMIRFLEDAGSLALLETESGDPAYTYGGSKPKPPRETGHPTHNALSQETADTRAKIRYDRRHEALLCSKRPIIWKAHLGKGLSLLITTPENTYNIPHDDLVAWAGQNTNALNTSSWLNKGIYSWPSAPKAMRTFLETHSAPEVASVHLPNLNSQ